MWSFHYSRSRTRRSRCSRCGCRNDESQAFKHGKWGFAVDVPSVDGKRHTLRRHQWTTKRAAARARDDVLARFVAGVKVDDRERWPTASPGGWTRSSAS